MKIIDLLIKIANGEEVPKKIEYCRTNFYYDDNGRDYLSIENQFNAGGISICKYIFSGNLNDEIEIIEEEKKIPEKIEIYEDAEGHYFIDKHCKKIYITCDEVNFMVEEFNLLIDYLKSKGE